MSLETMPIEIELDGALTKGIIPLNVAGMANIKVAGAEEEGLSNAVERFLGKRREDVARIARETLEGSLRGVLATLTPEEANTEVVAENGNGAPTELRNLCVSSVILTWGS